MSTLPSAQTATLRHRHRPSCELKDGRLPWCCRCEAKNLAGRGKAFVQVGTKKVVTHRKIQPVFGAIRKYLRAGSDKLYRLWEDIFGSTKPKVSKVKHPATDPSLFKGLSIQYLIEGIVEKQFSFTHTFFHALGLCSCKDLDVLAALDRLNFPYLYSDQHGPGRFDRFGPNEHKFAKIKTTAPGGETTGCVIMEHTDTRNVYAFKTVTKRHSFLSTEDGLVSNEAYILLGQLKTNIFKHPNVIQMFNCVTSNAIRGIPLHILQMEYCTGGDLYDLIQRCAQRHVFVPLGLSTHIFVQLIEGLNYLHRGISIDRNGNQVQKLLPRTQEWTPILHNDIKPENILLRWPPANWDPTRANDSQLPYPDIVLADFGSADIQDQSTGPRGTPTFAAPEVQRAFEDQAFYVWHLNFRAASQVGARVVCTPASDVWSLGAVMWSVFSRSPFGQYWDQGVEGRKIEWMKFQNAYSSASVNWTRRCLGLEPCGRPTTKELSNVAVKEIKDARRESEGEGMQDLLPWIWAEDQRRRMEEPLRQLHSRPAAAEIRRGSRIELA